MQRRAEDAVLVANRALPPTLIKLGCYVKHAANGFAGKAGFGDVMVKIAVKPAG